MSSNKSFFETVLDVFTGIRIILSPLMISAIPAAIIFFKIEGWPGSVIPSILLLLGLIIGIIWAIRAARQEGTFNYLNKINRSPELDKVTKADIEQTERRKNMEQENC